MEAASPVGSGADRYDRLWDGGNRRSVHAVHRTGPGRKSATVPGHDEKKIQSAPACIMRHRPRIDANHVEIVKALRQAGASVQSLAGVGKGCPDLLVARAGQMWLIEV